MRFPSLPKDEIGKLGSAFESIRTELEGKKYIENYVHNLTHEIKAPLTALVGASELIQDHRLTSEEQSQLLSNIRSEAKRLQDIAEKILELASLEARSQQPNFETFDLSIVIDEVVESLDPIARVGSALLSSSPGLATRRAACRRTTKGGVNYADGNRSPANTRYRPARTPSVARAMSGAK